MKLQWHGYIRGVQPRIRLTRSFDERSHTYLGFVLWVDGEVGAEEREFLVGIGKAAQAKHQFRVGDTAEGLCKEVANSKLDPVDFYKVSQLARISHSSVDDSLAPPWTGVAVELPVYRERGHRRLSKTTYTSRCRTCIWGCQMAVEMIIDQWNSTQRKYRFETFCYGPKSCAFYKAGPTRKVPGRRGMSWEEEDWVDEDATSHRGPDD